MFKSSYFEEMQCRCNPPVEASSGREQYYIRSASHLQSCLTFRGDTVEKMQMYPPVEASSGQKQYYMRSAWHLQSCLTLWGDTIEQMQMLPPCEVSSGQQQYYIRSAWHLQSDVRSAWHLQSGMSRSDLSNKLQCRRMSTVLKWIWVHEQLTRKSL